MNAQEVEYGVKGGLNVASLRGSDKGFDSRGGFHIGGFAEIKMSEQFFLQPELLFSQQGTKGTFLELAGAQLYEVENTIRYDYLNIPVMLKFYFLKDFSLLAGPQIGYLVSAKEKIKVKSISLQTDVKNELKELDFGFNFGMGYNFTKSVFAEATYNLGLTYLGKESEMQDIRNRVVQVSLGYKF